MQPWFAEFRFVGQHDDAARSFNHRAVLMGFVFQKCADAGFRVNAVSAHDEGVEAHFGKSRINQSSGHGHGFTANVAAGQHHLMLLVAEYGLRHIKAAGHDDKRRKIAKMRCKTLSAGTIVEEYSRITF